MRIVINQLKKAWPILVIPFFFYAKCNKDGSRPCRNAPYSFNVTSEFSPQKEIYQVGDTIILTSSFPKILINLISGQSVEYSNSLGISGNFKTFFMDTTNKTIQQSLNQFSCIVLTGQQKPIQNSPNSGLDITYLETSTNYEFKMSIKLLAKGLFYIGVTDLGSQGLRGQNCTNAGFNMTVTNTNKNLHLFQYALGYTPDALLEKYIYCFRVQ